VETTSWQQPTATIKSQKPVEWQVATKSHSSYQADGPLVLVRLPEGLIQREAAYAFINELKSWNIKHLLMGSLRSLNEALNKALKQYRQLDHQCSCRG
jgi:hypothetical protein